MRNSLEIRGIPLIYGQALTEARAILGRDAPSRARQAVRANDTIVATTRPRLNAAAQVPSEALAALRSMLDIPKVSSESLGKRGQGFLEVSFWSAQAVLALCSPPALLTEEGGKRGFPPQGL